MLPTTRTTLTEWNHLDPIGPCVCVCWLLLLLTLGCLLGLVVYPWDPCSSSSPVPCVPHSQPCHTNCFWSLFSLLCYCDRQQLQHSQQISVRKLNVHLWESQHIWEQWLTSKTLEMKGQLLQDLAFSSWPWWRAPCCRTSIGAGRQTLCLKPHLWQSSPPPGSLTDDLQSYRHPSEHSVLKKCCAEQHICSTAPLLPQHHPHTWSPQLGPGPCWEARYTMIIHNKQANVAGSVWRYASSWRHFTAPWL